MNRDMDAAAEAGALTPSNMVSMPVAYIESPALSSPWNDALNWIRNSRSSRLRVLDRDEPQSPGSFGMNILLLSSAL